jgi:hypothetical protein
LLSFAPFAGLGCAVAGLGCAVGGLGYAVAGLGSLTTFTGLDCSPIVLGLVAAFCTVAGFGCPFAGLGSVAGLGYAFAELGSLTTSNGLRSFTYLRSFAVLLSVADLRLRLCFCITYFFHNDSITLNMEIVQFYLQHFDNVLINNEYSTDIPTNTYLQIQWFPHNDLLINNFKINTDTIRQAQNEYLIIQIDNKNYLLRPVTAPQALGENKIDFENNNIIIAGNYIINKKTNEYIIADQVDISGKEFIAIKSLRTKLGHTAVIKTNDKYLTRQKGNRYIPQNDYDLALCFLQCVKVGDISTAEKFLSFATEGNKLKDYFGEFEILEFMNKLYIYGKQKHGYVKARSVDFEIINGKINNISFTNE